MRVIAWLSLFFGFTGLMLLDGQTFSHAIIGIFCGLVAIGSGLVCARNDYANGGRRWGGRGTAFLGLGLAIYCVIRLPLTYRYQSKFNSYRQRHQTNPAPDFHVLGLEDAKDASIRFDAYKHVFTAQISEDHWESRGQHKYALHHFKTTVTKNYKGCWNVGEKVAFVYGVDAPAPAGSNALVGANMLFLTGEQTNKEIVLGCGDFLLIDPNLEQVLVRVFPHRNN